MATNAIEAVKKVHPARFRIRWSNPRLVPDGATVIENPLALSSVIQCPAQTDDTACCATCGLCWENAAREKTITFLKHGPKSTEAAVARVNKSADLDDDERYELEERVRQLEGVLKDDSWVPAGWGLTAIETTIINVLLKRSIATKEAIHAALYGDDDDGGPDEKIIDVHICKLRPKISPFGLSIDTVWGQGFRLPPDSFAVLDAMQRGLPPPMKGEPLGSALAKLDVRPIIPIMLPANMKPAKLDLDRPEVRMARISDLKVESSYQRDMTPKSMALIRKIVTGWDWAKFKLPICAEKEDGSLVVIDGQHTAIAAASHPGLAALPVLVVQAKTVEKRAESFVSHNRDRIAMSPLQLFHAEVAAGVEAAVGLLVVTKAAGVSVPRSPPKKGCENPGTLVAITAAQRVYKTAGASSCERVLWIAAQSGLLITSTLVYGLQVLLREVDVFGVEPKDDAMVVATIKAIPNFEKAVQAFAGVTEQNRYRAAASLIKRNMPSRMHEAAE